MISGPFMSNISRKNSETVGVKSAPSAEMIALYASGRRAPNSNTRLPPIEHPMMAGFSSPKASIRCSLNSAWRVRLWNGPDSGSSDLLCPGASIAMTRNSSERPSSTCLYIRESCDAAWKQTSGRPSPDSS
ncbi:hypothetical protein EBI_26309 [Enterocytozoon bieneusi H348]|nr:hypothetical protein EBI_26309 [Enterocytozoon bieneusi H348]|eukprot:XP_002652381.1 hypothetical protein EBI_26309 [Enterocytozoon bieneusi H348]